MKIGDIIAGKYRLDAELGRGGFGAVFRAVDTTVDRAVALKVLHGSSAADNVAASRFVREAQVVAQLQGENTVRIFDFGKTEAGDLFMVMELLGGCNLSELIERRRVIDPYTTERVVRQTLGALREAHAAGLLHRDIKPSNIRISDLSDATFRVKLMDFGIARVERPGAPTLTAVGTQLGTPRYMAPEQLIGASVSAATDLFALGIVAYEMLGGDVSRLRDELIRSAPIVSPVGGPLGNAIGAMLRARPEDRPQSAAAVLGMLGPAGGSTPVTGLPAARPPSGPAYPPSGNYPANLGDADNAPARRGVSSRPFPAPAAPATGLAPKLVPALIAAAVGAVAAAAVFGTREEPAPVAPSQPRVTPVAAPLITKAEPRDNSVATATDLGLEAGPRDGCIDPSDGGQTIPSELMTELRTISYVTYVPRGMQTGEPIPLWIVFHADGGAPEQLIERANLKEVADKAGFAIAAPAEADLFGWRDPIEDEVIEQILDQARHHVCLDDSRIFAFGYGAGGLAAEGLVCSSLIRAIATMSHRTHEGYQYCDDTSQKPYAHFAPLRSKHLPIKGGVECTPVSDPVISLELQQARGLARNKCDPSTARRRKIGKSTCTTWKCDEVFELCRVEGGHGWPDAPDRKADLFNCDGPVPKFPYTRELVRFFGQFESGSQPAAQ